MKNRIAPAIATLALSVLSTGAFAQAPAAGEGPVFVPAYSASSTLSREAVRTAAAAKAHDALNPRRHESDPVALMQAQKPAAATRAEVRAQTWDAFAHGAKLSVGEQS